MTEQVYSSGRSQYGAPSFVSESFSEMPGQAYSSGRSQYGAEPPPTWSHRLSSVGPELKTPDEPQRKRRGSDPSSVQEPFPGISAPNHPSKRFQYDSEASQTPNDSLASADPNLKTCDVPQNVRFVVRERRKILENWYQQNQENPYPAPDVMDELMSRTKSTEKQIRNWLRGKRRHDPSRRESVKFSTSRGLSRAVHDDDTRAVSDLSFEPVAIGTKSDSETEFARAQSAIELAGQRGRMGMRIVPARYPSQRQKNNIYQCTNCCRGHSKYPDWDRHEKRCGPPEKIYVCMKTALSRTDASGNPRCPFCGGADSSDQHLNDKHNHRACLQKPEVDRHFKSSDYFHHHFTRFHRATEQAPASWCVKKKNSYDSYWCGFCGEYLVERKHRNKHIAAHFRDTEQVFDMTRWKSEPPRPESPRLESPRLESPCLESPRSESSRPEPSRPEPSRPEPSRPEPPG